MKRKMPFKISRCETFGKMVQYEFTRKEDMMEQIMKWIANFVQYNQINSKIDRALTACLREMTDVYAKFLDHYDLTYNFNLYHKRVSEILREHGIGVWSENESNTKT